MINRPVIDPDGDIISTQGTVQFFTELGFKQDEDELDADGDDDTPKLLLLAYELQSPRLGEWTKRGWLDGWKSIGSASVSPVISDRLTSILHRCDSIDGMKTALTRLQDKLGSDPSYFRTVYNFTFNFARSDGQRSLGMCVSAPSVHLDSVHLHPAKDTALEYWKSLLYFGVGKEALKHVPADDEDIDMDQGQGWTRQHTEMWLVYMKTRDDVAVSKDTWQMVRIEIPFSTALLTRSVQLPDFIRSFDGDFNKHDDQGNAMCASFPLVACG